MFKSVVCGRSYAADHPAGLVFLSAALVMAHDKTVVGWLDSDFRGSGIARVHHARAAFLLRRRDAETR